jgi:ADP-ribose pyrophosphatase YjhB (NUDIX family)
MNRKLSASCIIFKDDKVLLVKHTYGAAKGKYLIPGGFAEENELPEKAAEREVFEETNVKVKIKNLVAVRFTTEEVWCIFSAEYIFGEPRTDLTENDDALFMDIKEAVESEKVVETTRVLIKTLLDSNKHSLAKSKYINSKFTEDSWQLYI